MGQLSIVVDVGEALCFLMIHEQTESTAVNADKHRYHASISSPGYFIGNLRESVCIRG
jgi:hypothetical protein